MKEGIKNYIAKWKKYGYSEIPDEVPLRIHQLELAPSYKDLALLILNNEIQINSNKKSKWYFELKRVELTDKGVIKKSNQLKLKI
jgi:predicted phosphoadenosine phosphosulfate sulfurtransferase